MFGGLLGLLAHRDLEHRQQGVGGERPQRFERLQHLVPVLVGPARLVERLPDLFGEEVDVGAGDRVGVLVQLRRERDRRRRADAELDQPCGGAVQARADHLDLAVGEQAQHAELLGPLQQLLVDRLHPPALGEVGRPEDFRRLVLERGAHGAGEVDHLLEEPPVLSSTRRIASRFSPSACISRVSSIRATCSSL